MSDLTWQKSSFSDGPGLNCVELATAPAASTYARATSPRL